MHEETRVGKPIYFEEATFHRLDDDHVAVVCPAQRLDVDTLGGAIAPLPTISITVSTAHPGSAP